MTLNCCKFSLKDLALVDKTAHHPPNNWLNVTSIRLSVFQQMQTDRWWRELTLYNWIELTLCNWIELTLYNWIELTLYNWMLT